MWYWLLSALWFFSIIFKLHFDFKSLRILKEMEFALEVVTTVLEYFGWDRHEIEVSFFLRIVLQNAWPLRRSQLKVIINRVIFFPFQELFNQDRRLRNRRRSIVRRIVRELSRYNLKLFTKRSIVREIGSRLPLKPCRRPYFEVSSAIKYIAASSIISCNLKPIDLKSVLQASPVWSLRKYIKQLISILYKAIFLFHLSAKSKQK